MKELHEQLFGLAQRLTDSGQKEDAALVFSAAFKLVPGPKPTFESFDQPIPGLYHHVKAYL